MSCCTMKKVLVAGAAVGALYVAYRCVTAAKAPAPRMDALVMSGPSGVGKGTIIGRLMKERPGQYAFCVSHTTRAPREGEVNGKDYHFLPKEEMQRMVDNGEFLEACTVHGNMYGTSKAALKAVRDSGKVPILEVDVQGAQKIKAGAGSEIKCAFMFVGPPSMEELERRIVNRGSDTPEKVKVRLETARREMEFLGSDAAFFDKVLINVDLEAALQEFYATLASFGL